MGLVDSLGELRTVLQARYGQKVRLPVVAARRRLWQRLSFGSSIGGIDTIGPSLLAALEERAHWQRFGL
jgi:serine protease SohB